MEEAEHKQLSVNTHDVTSVYTDSTCGGVGRRRDSVSGHQQVTRAQSLPLTSGGPAHHRRPRLAEGTGLNEPLLVVFVWLLPPPSYLLSLITQRNSEPCICPLQMTHCTVTKMVLAAA